MNKMTKAAIATGAAIVLLLGGGGTLAYWNGAADLGAATINTGELTVAPGAATAAWTYSNGSATDQPIANIATFNAVPGDELTYRDSVALTASGNNLRFTVEVVLVDAAGAPIVLSPANAELQAVLDDATISLDLAGLTGLTAVGGATNTYTVASDFSGDVPVEVVLDWGFNDVTPATPAVANDSANASQNKSISISNIRVLVTQIVNP